MFFVYGNAKAQIHGGFNCMKEIENISARYPYNQCDYVGAVTWGLYGIGERMRKDEFERYTTVEFEGHYFKAFSCWDSYLRGLYGNYMELPPENKRHTHKINAWYEE